VFQSTRRTLRTVLRELALQSHEHVSIDEVVLALYPRMMSRLLEEADRLPSRTIVHVRFEELERDPLGQVELHLSLDPTRGVCSCPAPHRGLPAFDPRLQQAHLHLSKEASDGSPNAGSHS
jgi:hypothetical protein